MPLPGLDGYYSDSTDDETAKKELREEVKREANVDIYIGINEEVKENFSNRVDKAVDRKVLADSVISPNPLYLTPLPLGQNWKTPTEAYYAINDFIKDHGHAPSPAWTHPIQRKIERERKSEVIIEMIQQENDYKPSKEGMENDSDKIAKEAVGHESIYKLPKEEMKNELYNIPKECLDEETDGKFLKGETKTP
ncbi:hypothetical protein N7451_003690 [Penicillium sp. IBT 35674x]|nr:hypothetical protein N7451_003690 [Penicillium sp. IBT 35674x]